MRDDRKSLNNQLEMYLWAGLALLGVHFYVELYNFFVDFGLASRISDNIIGKFAANPKLFGSPWPIKLLAGACIVGYGVSSRGVKSTTMKAAHVARAVLLGLLLYAGSTLILRDNSGWFLERLDLKTLSVVYIVSTVAGILYLLKGTQGINRLLSFKPGEDEFNEENETFPQEERLLENKYSVNLPTEYVYKGKLRHGWLNISAVFRGLLLMGSPGSGKTYGIIHPIIRQHIAKGFSMYVYDYKFPSLSLVTFNAMIRHKKKLHKDMKFYCINFEHPQKSNRCNPIHPMYLDKIEYAYQSAKSMMLNLNKKWIDQQGEFFVESPINYVTALIWFLKIYEGGKYCTVPHLVELVNKGYRKLFPILASYSELENYVNMFISALQGGAMEQLEGQMASAQMGLSKLSSPGLYWVMSANEFTLDINNPDAPKILCLGNSGKAGEIYGAALGLYNFRVLELINQEGKHQSSIVIDELPTLYFKGLNNLIATGRSNRVAVTIAMQDYSQLESTYGRTGADEIKNTCGNIISGQVYDKTAESMQNRLGKNVQQKQSINIQSEDTTHGIATELNYMAPAAKIGQLSQGRVVGVLADNKGQESSKKAFNALVLVDEKDFNGEQKIKELPNFSTFAPESMDKLIQENYTRIKSEVNHIVESELKRLRDATNGGPKKP